MTNQQQETRTYGRYMYFFMWLALLGLLSLYFYQWDKQSYNPNQAVQSRLMSSGTHELTLIANRAGHYVADGMINGVRVTFLLDTGASDAPTRSSGRPPPDRAAGCSG